MHAPADRLGNAGDVDGLESTFAVRAGTTLALMRIRGRIRRRDFLSEIPRHVPVQTIGGAAIAHHAIQQASFGLPHDFLIFRGHALVLIIAVE